MESRHSEVTDILEKVIKLKKDFDESFLLGKSGKLFIARCVEMCLILHHFLIIFSIFQKTPTFTFGSWLIFYSFPSSVNFVLLQFENHLIFTEEGGGVFRVMGNSRNYERSDLWISNYGAKLKTRLVIRSPQIRSRNYRGCLSNCIWLSTKSH